MVSKNSEAPTARTVRASVSKTQQEAIDMNIVTKSALNFQGKALVPVSNITGIWLTSADLAKALNYKSSKSITNLFNQYSDEFSSGMSQVIESVTSGNYRKKVRVFSLRGAHLIAMFARTDVAKEFRRWVLDILDREVEQGNVNPAFDFEMHARNMTVARKHFKFIYEAWCHQLDPALRAINSPVAAELVDHLKSLGSLTYGIHLGLDRAEKSKLTH
ncbi:Bro-N domain-containing protein [Hafnia alvei]|uniref:BRO-N domain-containing protein n=1 Tax=Hafnia alvei TaxID=569 RepID=UPI001F34524A|nr:Bro-N domain-containing protein [Hafnia alvei]MCE9874074.1 Bro-N domain-containing protein [Hafnia alvei]